MALIILLNPNFCNSIIFGKAVKDATRYQKILCRAFTNIKNSQRPTQQQR